jgi:Galactose oxidase, central domain
VKPSVLLLTLISSVYLLNACGGGGSSSGGGGDLAATHFSVTAPATVSAGSDFSLTVTALDAANNVATDYSGKVTFTSSDGHAALPSSLPTLVGGTGTFTVALSSVGKQTITATDLANSTITGVTGSITVAIVATRFNVYVPVARNPAAIYNFTFTAGAPLNFTVTAFDGLGNIFPGYTGKVNFTSTDGQAVLPTSSNLTNGTGSFSAALKTTGNQTITATDTATASITGTSISIHVVAPPSGFTPAGRMQNSRQYHTMTLLKDGKVLVVGGMDWFAPVNQGGCPVRICFILTALASAEIFDPAAGTFTSTGGMSANRVFHTATLLDDGGVLVTGGDDRYTNTYDTAEIFDPSTGVFTLTGTMLYARSGHTATLLANGKVLLAGGAGAQGIAPLSAELFDPATGLFTATGAMITTRIGHSATLLSDGKVLLAGGASAGESSLTAELFDPATGTFAPTGTMSAYHSNATLLKTGLVLMTGGGTATAELFDPKTGTFAPAGSLGTMLGGATATLLPNGKVLVTGGLDANDFEIAAAEMFDPASATFTPAGNMEVERTAQAAVLLTNGDVLITGGANSDNVDQKRLNTLASAELFP